MQSHSSSSAAGYRSSVHRPQKQPADSDLPHPHPHLHPGAMAAFPASPPQDKPAAAAGVLALHAHAHARAGPAARFRGRDGGEGDSADSIAPNLEDEDGRGFAESPLEQPSPLPSGRSLLFDDRGSIAADSRLKKRKVGDSER